MESKKTKDYIIRMPGARILATDDRAKADKKIAELTKQELGTFSFTDNVERNVTSYKKEPYQKNYRITTNKLPEGEN